MVAAAAGYAYCVDDKVPSSMAVWELGDWWGGGGLAALALLGDIIEFLAGALGVKRKGGSKRGALFAIIGSFAGGLVGIFVGIPVPIVGPIIVAFLFASLGALAGAGGGPQPCLIASNPISRARRAASSSGTPKNSGP